MDLSGDLSRSTRHISTFPGIARRQSTRSQRNGGEIDAHQAVQNAPSIEEKCKEFRLDIETGNDTYVLHFNHSPEISVSGQSIAQEESTLLSQKDILDAKTSGDDNHERIYAFETFGVQMNRSHGTTIGSGQCIAHQGSTQLLAGDILDTHLGEEDSHDSEATGYFLERQESQFKRCPERGSIRLHSIHGESTQAFNRDAVENQVAREGNEYDVESTPDESYFLADYQFQFKRPSEQDAGCYPTSPDSTEPLERQHPTYPDSIELFERQHPTEPTLAFVHSNKRKSNRGTKQRHTTPGDSNGVDGEYWRKIFLNGNGTETEESSLEKGVTEPKRQWYRSRKTRPEYFRSSPTTNVEFWFTLLAIILSIIIVVLFFTMWKKLLTILF